MAMQAIVNQILDGKYDYENSSLDFSCAKVELNVHRGDICEGSFHVYCSDSCYVEGYVSATDMRMECVTTQFTGSGEEIFYCFHGENLESGEVVKGNFVVVSNQGEYSLPFVVNVTHQAPDSSIGNVKNLFHFANLAKSNWKEAVSLFYSPQFCEIFEGNDKLFYESYRALSVKRGNEQNVEEFLIHINKKQKTEFLVRETEIRKEFATATYGVVEAELNIVKNGWGYTALQVACEGAFLFTEKEILGEDDFLGNRCVLPVFIDADQCRAGKNFGKIQLFNAHFSITIPVEISIGGNRDERRIMTQKKREIVRLMECYQNFRMKKINSAVWMQETDKIVDSMIAREEDDIAARLFKAQLLISEERYNEADWTLNHAADMIEELPSGDDVLYAYYLYLTTLLDPKESYIDEVTDMVEQLYSRSGGDWRIAWLLLYLSEEYNKTPAVKWQFLVEQFERGCASPAFYIEGLQLLNSNPTILRKLDDFALQVLYYGAKKEVISPELKEQLIYLSGRTKAYSPVLLKTLQKLYEKAADEHVLEEICTLLVRGNCVGKKYFSWYAAGVEAQLRITNLYEYYMMSIDFEDNLKLPRIVLMYFAYQNNLDLKHSAFLYWYVEQHKMELGEFYDSYKSRMEYFVVDQIQKERINRHLAFLYQRLLTPAMINEQTAKALAKLLFVNRVTVSDSRVKKVYVYQAGIVEIAGYPLQNGVAYVPMYGNACELAFEDGYGNRFVKTVEYTLEKLMLPGKYLRLVAAQVEDCIALDMYLLEQDVPSEEVSPEYMARLERIIESDKVDELVRSKSYLQLLKCYYDADNMKALDECLENSPMELFDHKERAEILRYSILRGKTVDAYKWIREYGPHGVDVKALVRLLDEKIEALSEEDGFVTELALLAFRQGKYDSNIIQYLAQYAQGTIRELRDIWKAAKSYDVDTYALCERILLQTLYSGAYIGERIEIFTDYLAMGADADLEEAFLAKSAYEYFAKDRLTDKIIFYEIGKLAEESEDILRVCKLAYLKFYAENPEEVTAREVHLLGEFLHEMLAEKTHLNAYKNFMNKDYIREPLLLELMDKTIVEYKGRPGAKVSIHYVIMHEDGEAAEYLTEPMREVYGGVCFKEFVLFFGESLQYYITEEKDGEEQLTESGNLQKSDLNGKDGDWRYELINDILISRTLEDFETLDGLLDEYCKREYLGENLFTLQ